MAKAEKELLCRVPNFFERETYHKLQGPMTTSPGKGRVGWCASDGVGKETAEAVLVGLVPSDPVRRTMLTIGL